jgi:hypothetical protein
MEERREYLWGLTDAQYIKVLFSIASVLAVLLLWGIDRLQDAGYTKIGEKKHNNKFYWCLMVIIHGFAFLVTWVLLKPFIQLTVIYHELSHALTALVL